MIYIFSPFSLFVSVYVNASVCDFVCIALLLPFVLDFCLSISFVLFCFFSMVFSTCYHWRICFFGLDVLSFFLIIKIFSINIFCLFKKFLI